VSRVTCLIITAVFPPEPVVSAQISNDLAREISEKVDVVVLCPKPSRPAGSAFQLSPAPQIQFKRIILSSFLSPGASMIGRMIESLSFGRACKKYIRAHSEKISVIYANTWPLFAQLSVVKSCIKYNIPLILHIQDIYPETLTDKLGLAGGLIKKVLLPIDRFVLRNSRTIVTIGQRMAEFISATRGIDNIKIAVIYNWQDESRFKEPEYIQKAEPGLTFMYLGSLSPSANIEAVIEAFGDAGLRDSTLVIAGSGNSKQSCIQASSVYPNANIRFVDAPSDKVPELLASANVLILPLKKGIGKYSTPSKLAGYMLSSKPVLAFIDKESDAADIIRNAECGWIVPSGNIQALTMKMQEISSFPKTALTVPGQSGRSYALKHLSKAVNLAKLTDLIMSYSIQ